MSTRIAGPALTVKVSPRDPGSRMVKGPPGSVWRRAVLTAEGGTARVQNELFDLGSDVCFVEEDKAEAALPQIEQRHIDALERLIDELNRLVGPLENFILPGGSAGAAQLHLARAVCRRAERDLVALARREPVGPFVIPYLNRLSDALFVMARCENRERNVPEPLWAPGKDRG